MNLYVLLGGVALAIALFTGGAMCGSAIKQVEWDQEKAARTEASLVRERVLVREVPKIVTKVVTKEVTVTKEVERVVEKIPELIPVDCVLPDNYGLLLVAAANGVEPGTGDADAFAGTYGCREVLDATLKDLKAGWVNTARLDGLQAWTRLTTQGGSP